MASITSQTEGVRENRRKAFEFADSWAKQISTLATATIVLSATFLKDILPADSKVEARWFLYLSWGSLIASAILGLFVLGALTAHLTRKDEQLDIYSASIRWSSLLQFGTFVLGIGLFAIFAGINL